MHGSATIDALEIFPKKKNRSFIECSLLDSAAIDMRVFFGRSKVVAIIEKTLRKRHNLGP